MDRPGCMPRLRTGTGVECVLSRCSSGAEQLLGKQSTWVRFPTLAPFCAGVVQRARTPGLYPGCRGFESCRQLQGFRRRRLTARTHDFHSWNCEFESRRRPQGFRPCRPTGLGLLLLKQGIRVRIPAGPPRLWRNWPSGLGAGLWTPTREFNSLIPPQKVFTGL